MKKLMIFYLCFIIFVFLASSNNEKDYSERSSILKCNYSFLVGSNHKFNVYLYSKNENPFFTDVANSTYYLSSSSEDLIELEYKSIEVNKVDKTYQFIFNFNQINYDVCLNDAYFVVYYDKLKYIGYLGSFYNSSEYNEIQELNCNTVESVIKNGYIDSINIKIDSISEINKLILPSNFIYTYEFNDHILKIDFNNEVLINNLYLILESNGFTYKISNYYFGIKDFSYKTIYKSLGVFNYDNV